MPNDGPACFFSLMSATYVSLRPAERAVLLQLHVLAVEHELGGHVPDAGADVQAAEIGRDLVAAGLQVPQLRPCGSWLRRRRPAGTNACPVRATWPTAKLAVALVLPAAPLGEDQSELVPLLGNLERRIFDQVRALLPGAGADRQTKTNQHAPPAIQVRIVFTPHFWRTIGQGKRQKESAFSTRRTPFPGRRCRPGRADLRVSCRSPEAPPVAWSAQAAHRPSFKIVSRCIPQTHRPAFWPAGRSPATGCCAGNGPGTGGCPRATCDLSRCILCGREGQLRSIHALPAFHRRPS